jgi:hypothetical protein
MPLTADERGKVRAALGYPQVASVGTLALGIPINLQMNFLIENAMTQVMEDALPRVRGILGTIDTLEEQLKASTCTLMAQRAGEIELRSGEAGKSTPDLLAKERLRWCKLLADVFGVPMYNFSSTAGGSTQLRNVKVKH